MRVIPGSGWTVAALAALLGGACGHATAAPVTPAAAPAPAESAAKGDEKPADDPAFPAVERGWKTADAATRAAIDAFAADYAGFLANAKTERQVVTALTELAQGASPLPDDGSAHAPGSRYLLAGPGGRAMAYVVTGQRPIEEGMHVVIAAIDAPRIDLKQQPLYEKDHLAMLDTEIYGNVDLKSWLVTPLALHVYAARPGAADGPLELTVGEKPDDPVLEVPDLLPHLSRHAQRSAIVDSPERMDAVAARTEKALVDYLRARGLSPRDFTSAEAELVPAGPPVFLGVDRAELAGYGHQHRALAYAAVRALAALPSVRYTSVVIIISKRLTGYTGTSGTAFVRRALDAVIAASAKDADMLVTQRALSRSQALVAEQLAGKPAQGLVLSPRNDDAMPAATRRLLDAMASTGAQHQVAGEAASSEPARNLGTLDLDTVAVGLPIGDRGRPLERLSVFDLYQARLAFQGWFQ